MPLPQELRDFFCADGQGLSDEKIRAASSNLDQLLNFCMMDSDKLLEMWQDVKQSELTQKKGSNEAANVVRIALVLSHRRDRSSATFLRKFANEGERSAVDGATGKRVTARQLESHAFKQGSLYFEERVQVRRARSPGAASCDWHTVASRCPHCNPSSLLATAAIPPPTGS